MPKYTFADGDVVAREPFATLVAADGSADVPALCAPLRPRLCGLAGVRPTEGPDTVELRLGAVTARPGAGRARLDGLRRGL